MRSAEALAGVLDRRQDLLRVLGPAALLEAEVGYGR